jgi:hypothetical protein
VNLSLHNSSRNFYLAVDLKVFKTCIQQYLLKISEQEGSLEVPFMQLCKEEGSEKLRRKCYKERKRQNFEKSKEITETYIAQRKATQNYKALTPSPYWGKWIRQKDKIS